MLDPTKKPKATTKKGQSQVTTTKTGKPRPKGAFSGSSDKKDDEVIVPPSFDVKKFPDILKLNRARGLSTKGLGRVSGLG